MTALLQLKEKLKAFYGGYSVYADIVLKFLLSFACFFWIRSALNYSSIFSNIFILLILALLCSVLPLRITPVCSAALIIGQAFGIGIDAGIVTFAIFLLLLIVFLRFVPEDSLAVILTPVGMSLGIPAFIPICFGLRRKPSSILSVASGCVVYYMISALSGSAADLKKLAVSEYAARLQLLLGKIVSDPALVVNVLAFSGVVIIVYAVRRMGFNHCFTAAVLFGGAVYLVFVFFGNIALATNLKLIPAVAGTAVSCILALILQFFFLSVDYRGTETIDFEDDDYYYYVKAVPKDSAARRKYAVRRRPSMSSEQDEAENSTEKDIGTPVIEKPDVDDIDFEKKLEDSLKNL